jgi:hypothetical protein
MFGRSGCGPFGHQMHGFGSGPMGGGGPFGRMFGGKGGPGKLLSTLNLTDDQLLRVAELKGKVFSKMGRSKVELIELKKEAFKELLQPQVDKNKLKGIKEQLKEHKSECIDLIGDNLIAFSEILTVEQKTKLRLNLVKKFLGLDLVDDEED